MPEMLDAPLSRAQVRHIYDRLGPRYDWLRPAEAAPKRGALEMLALRSGERVLEVGVGTGAVLVELARAVQCEQQQAAPQQPLVCGIDLSPRMVALARARSAAAGAAALISVREGDATALPFPDASFDAAFSSYVLDLLPTADIHAALAELARVLTPGGRVALVALSPGESPAARLFTRAYAALYRERPQWLAGCRPLALVPLLHAAGFTVRERRTWFRGHPSEAVLAVRPQE